MKDIIEVKIPVKSILNVLFWIAIGILSMTIGFFTFIGAVGLFWDFERGLNYLFPFILLVIGYVLGKYRMRMILEKDWIFEEDEE